MLAEFKKGVQVPGEANKGPAAPEGKAANRGSRKPKAKAKRAAPEPEPAVSHRVVGKKRPKK